MAASERFFYTKVGRFIRIETTLLAMAFQVYCVISETTHEVLLVWRWESLCPLPIPTSIPFKNRIGTWPSINNRAPRPIFASKFSFSCSHIQNETLVCINILARSAQPIRSGNNAVLQISFTNRNSIEYKVMNRLLHILICSFRV